MSLVPKSDAASPDNPARYPKRKRKAVSYAEQQQDDESSKEESASELSDDGIEWGVRKRPRKTPPKLKSPVRKEKPFQPFPFMSLPPELRIKIYEFALVDPDGVHVRSQQGRYRRTAVHCAPAACVPQYARPHTLSGLWWYHQRFRVEAEPPADPLPARRYNLVPSLLATCKSVYAEAAPFLYKQPFYFSDTYTLQAFLVRLQPDCTARLRDITIISWCSSRSHKAINLPAFVLLREATALQKLHIPADFGSGRWRVTNMTSEGDRERAILLGRKLYRDCFPWLEAVIRRGGLETLREVLNIGEVNLKPFYALEGAALTTERRDHTLETMFAEIISLIERGA